MKPSHPRRLALALALGICVLVALAVALGTARWLGPSLVVDEPLARSDVIFVTDGKPPQRELEGSALFHEGWAPRVALTLPRESVSEDVRRLAGEPPQQEHSSQILRRRGVPEAAIVRLERIVDNT